MNIEDKENFTAECYATQTTMTNAWYDPIDPQASITQQEICDLHFDLFQELRDKQRTSLSEYVSFSYLASLDLYINANMQEDYENCVNMDWVTKPNEEVTKFVTNNKVFLVWDQASKEQAAAEAAAAVQTACETAQADCTDTSCPICPACAKGMAFVYAAFETFLNEKFAAEYKSYSEDMFNQLHEQRLLLSIP